MKSLLRQDSGIHYLNFTASNIPLHSFSCTSLHLSDLQYCNSLW